MAGAKAQLLKIFAQNRMRALLPETSVCVFRIKTRSRKVTEVQPAVGRSVRRKPLVCSMGQNFGEVKTSSRHAGRGAPVRAHIKPQQKQPRAASSSPLLNCLRSLRQGAPCVRLRRRRQNGRKRLCGGKTSERCLTAAMRLRKGKAPCRGD